jgi:monoterpene epsilon-lactone hydrolase
LPAAGILVSPWTDLTQSGACFQTNAEYGPDAEYLTHWADVYLGGADPRQPYASPLFGELHGLPPLLIQAGGQETMLDDASLFAAAAARAGCAVTLEVYPGQPHSFQHEVGTEPVAREAVEHMVRFLQRWA